jgi:hypothetical protein
VVVPVGTGVTTDSGIKTYDPQNHTQAVNVSSPRTNQLAAVLCNRFESTPDAMTDVLASIGRSGYPLKCASSSQTLTTRASDSGRCSVTSGRTSNRVFLLTRTDREWSEKLDAALTAARREDLQHGTNAAYLHGCVCKDCRTYQLVRMGRSVHAAVTPGTGGLWLSELGAERREACTLCAGCPVFEACAAAATARGERFGVWAGRDRTVRPGKAAAAVWLYLLLASSAGVQLVWMTPLAHRPAFLSGSPPLCPAVIDSMGT